MLHRKRSFDVVDVQTPEELTEKLCHRTWCGCAGFRLVGERPLLLLNDSTSADGAQEYAIFDETRAAQIESLTVSWMTDAQLLEQLRRLRATAATHETFDHAALPSLHHPAPCAHCR